MTRTILKCNVGTPKGNPPRTLREVGVGRIVERRVSRWSPNLGSYGMGTIGMFGLCLSPAQDYPEEWLVLMIPRAPDWMTIDPLDSPDLPYWNRFSKLFTGATILTANITDNASILILQNGKYHYALELEIPEFKEWDDEDSFLDAWAISKSETIYC